MPSLSTPLSADSTLHIYYLEGRVPHPTKIDHPDFVGNWEEDGFSFLFFLNTADTAVAELIEQLPDVVLLDQFVMTYRDWQGGTVEPVTIGRFHYLPPWEENSGADPFTLTLDSGVVFGNGTHPTTRDCIEAMEIACRGGKVTSMLDMGTGTGVLALAAARLGCEQILAVDFNLLACQTAYRNVKLNGLSDTILVTNGQAEQLLAAPSDLLVANIHYAVMKELLLTQGFLRQKWFILSGLLNSEAEKVKKTLAAMDVSLLKHWQRDGVWNTFLGITHHG